MLIEAIVFRNPIITSYPLKAWTLRRFGARVGRGLVIKPMVRIKYPWKLQLGDHVWLGEHCWIDNFVTASIGSNVCISQGAYLCTGNHDWSDIHMGLAVRPITVESGAWIAAFARVGPGVTIAKGAVITLGAVQVTDARSDGIYQGNPAKLVATRRYA